MGNKTVATKICPYCFRKITNDEAGFLIKSDGARFVSPALNEVVSPKNDEKYLLFWNAMGVAQEQIDANRIIIDNDGITELNQELSAAGRELAGKYYEEDSGGYSFHVEEGAVSIYSHTMICPYCHNVLPQNFFKYEMLMVGLSGSVASGKTVYMSSLMMDSFDVLQRDNLTVRNAWGNPADEDKLQMERNADRLMRYGICPPSTTKTFKKPVFLEFTYRIEEKTLHFLVAIYDVAGELLRDMPGTGRTGFVRHMDGYICLVDPAQMHLDHAFIHKQIPDEEKVLSKLHLMSREEQESIQRFSNENGKQIMKQDDLNETIDTNDEYIYQRKAETILEAIRSGVGDHELKNKNLALTLAKSDLLEDVSEIRAYPGSHLLFDRSQVTEGFMNMNHHFLRQGILRQIFDQKVFRLTRSLEDYKYSSLFVVSALGCETIEMNDENGQYVKAVGKIRPIRVEEPLLWLVMKGMQEKGWLD